MIIITSSITLVTFPDSSSPGHHQQHRHSQHDLTKTSQKLGQADSHLATVYGLGFASETASDSGGPAGVHVVEEWAGVGSSLVCTADLWTDAGPSSQLQDGPELDQPIAPSHPPGPHPSSAGHLF